MNKLELVEHIAGEAELTKVSAAAALEAVLDGIGKALKKGDEVRLVGFGTFSVRERAAGKGRNPATGTGNQDRRVEERPLQSRRGAEVQPQRGQEGDQEGKGLSLISAGRVPSACRSNMRAPPWGGAFLFERRRRRGSRGP